MNRIIIICLAFLFFNVITAQEHLLEAPDDWRKEQLTLPPHFAPDINIKGVQYVRFSKGWGDTNSNQFWTFTFAWHLDEVIEVSEAQLSNDLTLYFNGLFQLIGSRKDISKETILNTTDINFEFDKKEKEYIGKAKLFDIFFSEKPMLLNIKASVDTCDGKQIVYYRFSLKEFDHELWDIMEDIRISCE